MAGIRSDESIGRPNPPGREIGRRARTIRTLTGARVAALTKTRATTLIAAALTSALLSCGPPPPKNPFDSYPGGKVGDPETRHRVQFEANCGGCSISWIVGPERGTDIDRGLWSHSLHIYTQMGQTVATLTATPTQGSGPVTWVRIRVDGKLAAQKRNDDEASGAGQASRRTLSVETLVPPPAG